MKTPQRRRIAGQLRWQSGDQIDITVGVDRVAVYNEHLAMLSCVGYTNEIKALRAGLSTSLNAPMVFSNEAGKGLEVTTGRARGTIGHVWTLRGGKYIGESHRLGYNVLHAIFVSASPGLMLEDTDEALWAEINHPRYTTPLLRGWLPYLRRELTAADKLVHLSCLDCKAMGLTATTADLDAIVEHGLKNGLIAITKEDAA